MRNGKAAASLRLARRLVASLSAPCRLPSLHQSWLVESTERGSCDQRPGAMVDSVLLVPFQRGGATKRHPVSNPRSAPAFQSLENYIYGYNHPSRGRCTERLNFHVSVISSVPHACFPKLFMIHIKNNSFGFDIVHPNYLRLDQIFITSLSLCKRLNFI